MMESVDKLRDYCDGLRNVDDNHVSAEYVAERCAADVRRMADEIEREIAERYMKVPVDADGVPIHPGATMWKDAWFAVCAVDEQRAYVITGCKRPASFDASELRRKPRTIVDVLADFAAEVEQGRNTIETAKKYADELRELMEVDE